MVFHCLQCFEILRRQQPKFEEKVIAVAGDIALPDAGLNETDRQMLMGEVDVIFHCAATVRFDDSLRKSTDLNVRCVRDLLAMAKQMKQLKVCVLQKSVFLACV